VMGYVSDANTGINLDNAMVSGDMGQETTTLPTPLDAQVEDGFYTLWSPADTHTFSSTISGYGMASAQVEVVLSDTVWLDLDLPAGWVDILPETLEITLPQGQLGTLPLTLTNQGGLAAAFDLLEIDHGFSGMKNDSPAFVPDSPGWSSGTPLPEPRSAGWSWLCCRSQSSWGRRPVMRIKSTWQAG
jgi:hypothetical protein